MNLFYKYTKLCSVVCLFGALVDLPSSHTLLLSDSVLQTTVNVHYCIQTSPFLKHPPVTHWCLSLLCTHHSRQWASRCVRCPGAACFLRAESCRSAAAWRAGTCWRCPPQRHPKTGTRAGRDSGTSLRKPALSPGWTSGCIWFQRSGKSWTGSPGGPYLAQ